MTAYTVIGVASRAVGVDLAPALTTPTVGSVDTFPPGSDIFLRLKCGATPSTVTVIWPTAVDAYGRSKSPYTLTGAILVANKDYLLGPFPANEFADPSDGQVHLNYSNVTTVTAGVYRTPDN